MTKSEIAYKRLFIGLELDKDTLKILNKYRDKMGLETPFFRWTAIGNLHITVLFLGDVKESIIPDISTKLQGISAITEPFVMMFDKPIYAPPNRSTSMIWIKIKENEQFKNLVNLIDIEINKLNTSDICRMYQIESTGSQDNIHRDIFRGDIHIGREIFKGIIPHITLARLKKDALISNLPKLGLSNLENHKITIHEMTLFESRLTPVGREYGVVQRFKFG